MKFLHKTIAIFVLFALLLIAVPPQPAYAATFTVTNSNDSGPGSLRQAIADATAAPGDDIIVFGGDYTITLSSTLNIGTNLAIDGSGHTITIDGNNLVQVMNITSGTVSLNALTIRNGSANDGGGISNNGTLTVSDSTFSGNSAITHGGGIENNGTLTVTNSTFSLNSADNDSNDNGNGGGITNNNTLTIIDSTFSRNTAVHGGGIQNGGTLTITNSTFSDNIADHNHTNIGHGGGINSSGTLLEITDSTFSDNSADFGGGIANDNGTVTVTGSGFSGNSAVHGGGISGGGTLTVTDSAFSGNSADTGGGIRNAGTLTVTDSTFSNNSANYGGGIYNANTMTITNSTFDSNYADNYGGGIYNNDTLEITNSTFSGNSANYGGGIYNSGTLTVTDSTFSDNPATNTGGGIDNRGTLTVTNSTFSGNSATLNGGGIYNWDTLEITNSTFSSNSANSGGGIYTGGTTTLTTLRNTIIASSPMGGDCSIGFGGTLTADTYNLDTDGTCDNATTSSEAAIDLGALADNGGDTETMAITNTSTAYDAGDNNVCPATDQRGVTRPQNTNCDVGAYEYLLDSTSPTVLSQSLVASYTTGPNSFTVEFSENVFDPAGNTGADDVTNPANYLLVEEGANGVFNTASCNGGLQSDDTQAIISSVTYDGSDTSTVNLGGALPDGSYRLFVCGTTSIVDLALNALNNGESDYTFDFTVSAAEAPAPSTLPSTGFAHGRITTLSAQPENKAYTETAMMLEIPKLGVSMPIVGVPQSENGWDVSWLGNNAGYLAGSAFPTWSGNTVITAHVWDAWNHAGTFSELKTLKYGDQVQIKAWGLTYTYEVRESKLVTIKNVKTVLQSEEYDWITLVTCEFYNPFTGGYLFRRSVRAVLVDVK